MNKGKFKRIISFALSLCIMGGMMGDMLSFKAYAEEEEVNQPATVEVTQQNPNPNPDPDPNPDPGQGEGGGATTVTPAICELCGKEGHGRIDCPDKCKINRTNHLSNHLDADCPRHRNCILCNGDTDVTTEHRTDTCPYLCKIHGISDPNNIHKAEDCPEKEVTCVLCNDTGHDAAQCPEGCTKHPGNHLASECPDNTITNDKIYITNYRVVNNSGAPLAKVAPGDKVIIAVTVIDERVKAEDFGITGNDVFTNRIHATMSQGAFSIPSSAEINTKLRNNVRVSGPNGYYNALCYTVEFRNVTYLGGTPDFGFSISYTNHNGNTTQSNNIPMPYPHQTLQLAVTQATDDVPSPTIILNSANYGKVAIIGEKFNLNTVATNTSKNLDLENVSVKIELPNGINMATGNSQVLIGDVPKNGTINHTFNLVAEGVANDINSLPVRLVYTFEAFVGGKRTQFTSQQDISINVQQPTRFAIQSVNTEYEMYQTMESSAYVSLVNKGKTTVYNVTAELISDTLSAIDVEFLGNIAPGSSTDASFDFTASQLGTATGKILITYEDAMGTASTLEQDFTIEVVEEPVWDEPMYTEPVIVEKTNYTPYIIAGVVVLGAACGFIYTKKKKVKKLAELEDEDEDI